MSEDEIFELIANKQGFMDITDFDYSKVVPQSGSVASIPTELNREELVNSVIAKLNETRVKSFVEDFSAYHNRYYSSQTGEESQLWLLSEVKETLQSYSGKYTVEEVDHGYRQKSIVARIIGVDDTLKNEVVIIGAHLDSVTSGATGKAPGADDNASGSVTVLETLRTIVESKVALNRTVEFQFYAAEEIGLRGSQAIAEDYRKRNVSVVGMMNLDVVGYHVLGVDDISIYTDYAETKLVEFLQLLADKYLIYGRRDNRCGYACSDHASFNRNSFPAAMVGEVYDNPHMHTIRDTLENMSLTQVHEFIKLAIGYVVEFGEGKLIV